MKMTSKKIVSGALAALCLTIGSGLKAADSTYDYKPRAESEIKGETRTTELAPTSINKASGIVGMTVRNQMDERLGKIKDLVFDLRSERVAYAVMSTGGLLNKKLLAVPLSAFTAGADNKYLILRAEKSKLETATGLGRDNWPSASNPIWGAEAFWENTSENKPSTDKLDKSPEVTPKPEVGPEEKPDTKPYPAEPKPETKPENK
jgi:hypothetical protein